jgi:hypothetical protein
MISDRLGCVAFETRSKPAHDRIRVVRVPAIERRVNSDRGNRIEANPEIMVLQVAANDIAHRRIVIHYEDVLHHHDPGNERSLCVLRLPDSAFAVACCGSLRSQRVFLRVDYMHGL